MSTAVRPAAWADRGTRVTAVEVTLGDLTVGDVERALDDVREWPRATDVFPHGLIPAGVRCRDEWVEGQPLEGGPTRVHPDDVPAQALAELALASDVADDLRSAWEQHDGWGGRATPDFYLLARRALGRVRTHDGSRA